METFEMRCYCRTEPVKLTKQEFDEDVVKRYLPYSRLSSGLLVVDESTHETLKQKFVTLLISCHRLYLRR